MKTTKENRFFDALRDLFVGAKVEGESGFINLMRIKSRYYTAGVFPRLKKDIDQALAPFPAFREELFDRLYDFFHRYFSESGSIYFRYTPLHQNVYERVYTDDRDVMLFWKTHMLYYVKTDRLFRSLGVELDGQKFFFDVSTLEHKKANEKREIVYTFREKRKDGTLAFSVGYSERGRKTKSDEILRAVRREGLTLAEDVLERAFRVFEKQSEVDYFINKDAKAFLEEQFDLWMYQYVFKGDSRWTETRVRQLQALKGIAFKIIAFISQFEDELVKVWNKPKFVLDSNYVITLGRIAEKEGGIVLVERLLGHKNCKDQVEEWRELGIVDQSFKKGDIFEQNPAGRRIAERWEYLPIDTAHFKDVKNAILALFDDLDSSVDGWLIRSENYQALNTMARRFADTFDAIYIDPPYNTGTEASEFIYENTYQHSSWLTFMENRFAAALHLLRDNGTFCVTIDDYEYRHLATLCDSLSGLETLGTVAIRNKPQGRPTATGFSVNHEYAVFLGRKRLSCVGRLPREGKKAKRYREVDAIGVYDWANLRKTGTGSHRDHRRMQYFPIYVKGETIRVPELEWDQALRDWRVLEEPSPDEKVLYPIDDAGDQRVWNLSPERVVDDIADLKVVRTEGGTQIHRKYRPNYGGVLPGTWWDDKLYSASESGTKLLRNILGKGKEFPFPKSVFAVRDCLLAADCGSRKQSVVLDFFAGSGTTAHAVMQLNHTDGGERKYVLVEVGDHFDSVILPRIKKLAFCSNWRDGKADGGKGTSQLVKYYRLEQYEDVLHIAKYGDADLFDDPNRDPYHQYVFLRDAKMLDALEADMDKNAVKVDLSRLYDGIDLPETLSNLLGKWIKRITEDSVEFEDGEVVDLKNLDWKRIKPLIWW